MAASSAADNPWLSVFDQLVQVTSHDGRRSSIYRVPQLIRSVRPELYTWSILPMGLYNRDLKIMTATDQLKLEVVSAVLKHVGLFDQNGWNTFCSEVTKLPQNPEPLEYFYDDLPNDSFITPEVVQTVLTIDAVFAAAMYFSYSRCVANGGSFNPDDYKALTEDLSKIFRRGSVQIDIGHYSTDMWSTFENQIPLFLIENVLKKIIKHPADFQFPALMREIVFDLLELTGLPYARSAKWSISFESCDHLLACVHKVVCPETPPNTMLPMSSDGWRTLPTVSQLKNVGIRVRGRPTGAYDIQFVPSFFNLRATLYLPQFDFDDSSESWLMNMCIYEYMTPSLSRKTFMAYMVVMDELICTEEDVQLLTRGDEPVFRSNHVGDYKTVVDVFNNHLKHFALDLDETLDHLRGVEEEIHQWYNSRWRSQLEHFLDTYVKAPWVLVTTIVATILLTATIVQTVYTVMGYKRGS